MKRLVFAGLALQLCALPALAQSGATPQGANGPVMAPPATMGATPAPVTSAPPVADRMSAVTPADAAPGANSFTEAQARKRLENNGYSQVSALAKGDDGIWRGTAMKSGSSVRVTVDFKGQISMN